MSSRDHAHAVVIIAALLSAPIQVALAADDQPAAAPASNHGGAFAEAVKRDTRAAGAAFKDGAHRIAIASKAAAHEIAAAAKRGAAATRDAFH
jgi:hypothetical protein